jgi:hypothetical protein
MKVHPDKVGGKVGFWRRSSDFHWTRAETAEAKLAEALAEVAALRAALSGIATETHDGLARRVATAALAESRPMTDEERRSYDAFAHGQMAKEAKS